MLTTRAKVIVGVVLLAVAVGAVLLWVPARRPQVELTFVRYADDGAAVLALTNGGRRSILVFCNSPQVRLTPQTNSSTSWQGLGWNNAVPYTFVLGDHKYVHLVAWPTVETNPSPRLPDLPASISVACLPLPPRPSGVLPALRLRVEAWLRKLGIIKIKVRTEVVATVNLPAR